MYYFESFPYINYPSFTEQNKDYYVNNITVRVVDRVQKAFDTTLFYDYTMREDESLESLSDKVYGDFSLYWVIMLINDRFDRFYDFPLTQREFDKYIINKYGSVVAAKSINKYYILPHSAATEYYEVPLETYNTYDANQRISKDMYQVEEELNEDKRNIRLLNSQYMTFFVNEFNRLVQE